jgi:molybdopterin-containing oxidoreductase family iron-sulfur binding subunit
MPLLKSRASASPPLGETSYWKSLEELRTDSRLLAERRREFLEPLPWQEGAVPPDAPTVTRRDFLAVMGFSLTAATLACSRAPVEKAVPFVNKPEELTPGVANWYATTCGGCSASCSLLVKTRDGRPIKIEGNPDSPLFGGGTCAVGQATVLSLYDEERLRGPQWQGRPASWAEVDGHIRQRLAATATREGRIVLLSKTITSPSTRDIVRRWGDPFPTFQHVVYEPRSLAALRRAYETSHGAALVPHYRFDRARVIVGLEADFLGTWLSPVEFTRQYVSHRRPDAPEFVSRHVHFESGLSLTGANADRRVAIAASQQGRIALGLFGSLRAKAGLAPAFVEAAPGGSPSARDDVPAAVQEAVDATADELWRARGESLVVSGAQDFSTQILVAATNDLLGNVGRTLELERPSLQSAGDDEAMERLIQSMEKGEVQALIVYGVDPAYDYPEAARFVKALENVALSVSLAERMDDTAAHVHAVCPDHHFLEAWGDAEPVRSVYSLAQPTIAPLFDTRAAQDSLLAWLATEHTGHPDYHVYLRDFWRKNLHSRQTRYPDFDDFWDRTLQAGFFEPSLEPAVVAPFAGDWASAAREVREGSGEQPAGPDRYELHLYETVGMRDGRHANNPWLQELPDPVTKVTWGNYAAVAPALAARHGLEDGDVIALVPSTGKVRLELPVLVQPGQAPTTISVAVGYGRAGGKVSRGVGANVYPWAPVVAGLRRSYATGVALEKTGRREPLASTQTHHSMEGRPIVREVSLARYRKDPSAGNEDHREQPSLWAEHAPGDHQWGMAVDLSSCTGCSACVVACQAENNVPVVGKDEVRRGREMHWIRLDRYYSGSPEAPDTVFQPMMCQHCNNAPCEPVCPVLATVHSSDGMNQQVYNRCIGTRYCENNCPYKVRRFNWFEYAKNGRFDYNMNSALGTMVLNPDVVVRSRGVMEKCSLCVQRVQAAKVTAKQQGRAVAEGDVQTACQQACPAQAIVFGDGSDPTSRLSRLRKGPRHYQVLGELGTRPNVGYLTKVRNREEA